MTRTLFDGVSPSSNGDDVRAAAEAEARARLAGDGLSEFERRLAVARRAYPNREENVVTSDHLPSGLIRRWVVEAGRRLVDRGLLARVDDVVWLDVDEIIEALLGNPGRFGCVNHVPQVGVRMGAFSSRVRLHRRAG